jgi:hypothetical protein
MPKSARLVFIVFLLVTAIFLQNALAASNASKAFQKMKTLAGDWEGSDAEGNAAKTNFKLVISDTTLMETLSVTGMHEMLTLYNVDNDGIALHHFCPTNNQPQMRAIPPAGEIRELVFQFQRGGNLPDINIGHEHKLVIQFEDDEHIIERWTWRSDGHDNESVYHFTRKPSKQE